MASENAKSGLTLTEYSHFSRLTVKYGLIFLAVLIVGRVFLTSLIAFWRALNPPPPPPPTVGFGLLPQIEFPQSEAEVVPTSYSLETASGGLPQFGDRAKVFLMKRSTPNLLADQRAREIAAAYDFVFEPQIVDSQTYRWQRSQPLTTQLQMNIFNQNFELRTDYLSRPDLIGVGQLPDDFTAVERVKRMLNTARLLPDDVATASGEIVYVKALGTDLEPAFSLSDADFIQVDLNRFPIDGLYRTYTPQGYQGVIHAVVAGAFDANNSIVALKYDYQPIDYQVVHTYPLRSAQQAWNVLRGGEGYVATYNGQGTALIRRVSLGYFESDQEQDYLQPVYVFEGDDDFLGYAPALDSEYLQAE